MSTYSRAVVLAVICASSLICYYLFLGSSSSNSPSIAAAVPHQRFDTQFKHKGIAGKRKRELLQEQQLGLAGGTPAPPGSIEYIAAPRAGMLRREHEIQQAEKTALERAAKLDRGGDADTPAAGGGGGDGADAAELKREEESLEMFLPEDITDRLFRCKRQSKSSSAGSPSSAAPMTSDDDEFPSSSFKSDSDAAEIDGECLSYSQRYSDCLWVQDNLSRRRQRALFSRVGFSRRDAAPPVGGGGREVILLRVGGGGGGGSNTKRNNKKRAGGSRSTKSSSSGGGNATSGVTWPQDRWLNACSLILEAAQCGRRHVFLYVLEGEENTAVPAEFAPLVRTHPDRLLREKFGAQANDLYSRGGPYQRGDLAAAWFVHEENENRIKYSSLGRRRNNRNNKSSSPQLPSWARNGGADRRYYQFAWVLEGDVRFAGSWAHFFAASKVLGRLLPDATVDDDMHDPIAPTPSFTLSRAQAALQKSYDAMYPVSGAGPSDVSRHVVRTGSLVRTGKNPTGQLFRRKAWHKGRVASVLRMMKPASSNTVRIGEKQNVSSKSRNNNNNEEDIDIENDLLPRWNTALSRSDEAKRRLEEIYNRRAVVRREKWLRKLRRAGKAFLIRDKVTVLPPEYHERRNRTEREETEDDEKQQQQHSQRQREEEDETPAVSHDELMSNNITSTNISIATATNTTSSLLKELHRDVHHHSAAPFGFNASAGDAHLLFFYPPIRNDHFFDPLRARFLGSDYNFDEYAEYYAQEVQNVKVVGGEDHTFADNNINNSSRKSSSIDKIPHPLPLMVPPPNTWHFTHRRHFSGRWFDKFSRRHLKKRWLGALVPAFGFSAEFADMLITETLRGDGHTNQEVDLTGLALLKVKKMVTTAGVLNSQFYFAAQHHEHFVPRTAPLYLKWRENRQQQQAEQKKDAADQKKNNNNNNNNNKKKSLSLGNRIHEAEAHRVYGIGTEQFADSSCLAGVLFHPVKDI